MRRVDVSMGEEDYAKLREMAAALGVEKGRVVSWAIGAYHAAWAERGGMAVLHKQEEDD